MYELVFFKCVIKKESVHKVHPPTLRIRTDMVDWVMS